jgi:polyisoprenoid-binding protein YceI
MKHFCAILIAFLLIASGAHASDGAEKFSLNKEHTTVGFSVRYLLLARVSGQFNDFKGAFVIDPAHPDNNRADIIIQTASVNTGIKTRDANIRGAGLFNADLYPTMVFHSNAIEMRDSNTGQIKGDLTLLGITKPVKLDLVKTQGANPNLSNGYKVTGKIKRSDFGMNAYIQPISNTVTLLVCYNMQTCVN